MPWGGQTAPATGGATDASSLDSDADGDVSSVAVQALSIHRWLWAVPLASWAGCRPQQAIDAASATADHARRADPSDPIFVDATVEADLDFRHYTGATGKFYLPEIMGAGVALLDYDNDGDLDVYAVQSALLGDGVTYEKSLFAWRGEIPPRNKLFRNDLEPGSGRPRFVDVTEQAGVGDAGYGMGVAVGDYDGDGDPDLYVTNFGSNVLYRNNGDGTFANVTAAAGADDPRWSVSATFVDYDNDGHADLFVVNYVDFSLARHFDCASHYGRRTYCHPLNYNPVPDTLLHNNGDGTFTDVTEPSGVAYAFGNGLGVCTADFNGDGRMDVYVANDATRNQLWINRGDGTFADQALLAGCAVNADGLPEAGMGVTAADFDDDGDEDIFLTHLTDETNTLYVNDGAGVFSDRTARFDIAYGSEPYTGFGTQWFDYDNDGFLDLMFVSGTVSARESLRDDPYPYHQQKVLLHNRLARSFVDVTARAGPVFGLSEVGRGAAFGDVDNDGDVDIIITNNNGPLRFLRNEIGTRRNWLSLRLSGTDDRRDPSGALVRVTTASGRNLWRRVHTDGSYASAGDPRLHLGLGDEGGTVAVQVRWPDGSKERWEDIPANAETHLREGHGNRNARAGGSGTASGW